MWPLEPATSSGAPGQRHPVQVERRPVGTRRATRRAWYQMAARAGRGACRWPRARPGGGQAPATAQLLLPTDGARPSRPPVPRVAARCGANVERSRHRGAAPARGPGATPAAIGASHSVPARIEEAQRALPAAGALRAAEALVDLAPQDLAPQAARLQIPPHRVHDQDGVLGAPGRPAAAPAASTPTAARTAAPARRSRRARRLPAARAVPGAPAPAPHARRCGSGTAAPCGPARARPCRTAPTAPRRPGGATDPSGRSGPGRARSRWRRRGRRGWRPSIVGTPRASRSMCTGARRPAVAHVAVELRQRGAQQALRDHERDEQRSRRTRRAEELQPAHAPRCASVERDLEDLHGVGAALHAGQLTLGEDHQIALLHQLAAPAAA